jgi:hypothetical protein
MLTCRHDGQASMLRGAAKYPAGSRNFNGSGDGPFYEAPVEAGLKMQFFFS